jgi:hypothetical protein
MMWIKKPWNCKGREDCRQIQNAKVRSCHSSNICKWLHGVDDCRSLGTKQCSCFPEVYYHRSVISSFIRGFNFLMKTFAARILNRNTLKRILLVSPYFRLIISHMAIIRLEYNLIISYINVYGWFWGGGARSRHILLYYIYVIRWYIISKYSCVSDYIINHTICIYKHNGDDSPQNYSPQNIYDIKYLFMKNV